MGHAMPGHERPDPRSNTARVPVVRVLLAADGGPSPVWAGLLPGQMSGSLLPFDLAISPLRSQHQYLVVPRAHGRVAQDLDVCNWIDE